MEAVLLYAGMVGALDTVFIRIDYLYLWVILDVLLVVSIFSLQINLIFIRVTVLHFSKYTIGVLNYFFLSNWMMIYLKFGSLLAIKAKVTSQDCIIVILRWEWNTIAPFYEFFSYSYSQKYVEYHHLYNSKLLLPHLKINGVTVYLTPSRTISLY